AAPRKRFTRCVTGFGGYSSVVEPQPSKLMMRVRFPLPAPGEHEGFAHIAQLVEHTLGKGEVGGSNPPMSSRFVGASVHRFVVEIRSQFRRLPDGKGKV